MLARNQLLLRCFLLAGTVCYIIYYYFISDEPLWDAIYASIVIGVTNLAMIGIIVHERFTLGMSPRMLALYASFPTLNPGEFRKIMKRAEWITAPEDTQICQRGVRPDKLYLISAGHMDLLRDGRKIRIGAGNFIGEISFLIEGPATADVVAPAGTEYVCWNRNELTALIDKTPRISNAISALFNKDIARKLSTSSPVGEMTSDGEKLLI